MGENTLAILEFLTSNASTLGHHPEAGPLPLLAPGDIIFSSFLGGTVFIYYSRAQASIGYSILVAIAVLVISRQIEWTKKRFHVAGVANVVCSCLGAVLAANAAAYLTGTIMTKPMICESLICVHRSQSSRAHPRLVA